MKLGKERKLKKEGGLFEFFDISSKSSGNDKNISEESLYIKQLNNEIAENSILKIPANANNKSYYSLSINDKSKNIKKKIKSFHFNKNTVEHLDKFFNEFIYLVSDKKLKYDNEVFNNISINIYQKDNERYNKIYKDYFVNDKEILKKMFDLYIVLNYILYKLEYSEDLRDSKDIPKYNICSKRFDLISHYALTNKCDSSKKNIRTFENNIWSKTFKSYIKDILGVDYKLNILYKKLNNDFKIELTFNELIENISGVTISEDIKLLGSGTYGCVVTPPIRNKNYIMNNDYNMKYHLINDNDVGKIFKGDIRPYLSELDELLLIKKIDPNAKFTVKLKGHYAISGDIFSYYRKYSGYNDTEECLMDDGHSKKSSKGKMYYQIILENGGKTTEKMDKYKFKDIIKLLNVFFHGMKTLKKKGIIHSDIKPDNVLIKPGKISLIDFGLSRDIKDFYADDNIALISYPYIFYPPEFNIYNELYEMKSNKLNEEFIKDNLMDVKDDYFSMDKSYDKYDINFKYLNEYSKGRIFVGKYDNLEKELINGIHEFIDIISEKIKRFKDVKSVFTDELAFKADIYGMAFVLYDIYQNTIFDTKEQDKFLLDLAYSCYNTNPYKRATIEELYEKTKAYV